MLTLKPYVPKLTASQKRMLNDPNYFMEVTSEEVRSLLLRLKIHPSYTREDVIRMRIKYDAWIPDDEAEKAFMRRLGLDYANHKIERERSLKGLLEAGRLTSDGYIEPKWLALVDDTYIPSYELLSGFHWECRIRGDLGALEILDLKYRSTCDGRVIRLVRKADASCTTAKAGISFYMWKLRFDDDFLPINKGAVISTIRLLRLRGDTEAARFIEDKYYSYLYPHHSVPVDSCPEAEEAQRFYEQYSRTGRIYDPVLYWEEGEGGYMYL